MCYNRLKMASKTLTFSQIIFAILKKFDTNNVILKIFGSIDAIL
jgi:hypothetical protein